MPVLKQTESTYTLIDPGTYAARCYGIVSLGTQPALNPQFKPTFKVVALFELPNDLAPNGKPMGASQFLNAYLGSSKKPSKTAIFLNSWRGRPFTEEEAKGFDLMKVVGAPCLLSIVHEERNGKVREVISSIAPLMKGMTIPPMVNQPIRYEIEDGKNGTFQALPEWMQKMIGQCLEWNTPPAAVDAHDEAADAEVAAKAEAEALPF